MSRNRRDAGGYKSYTFRTARAIRNTERVLALLSRPHTRAQIEVALSMTKQAVTAYLFHLQDDPKLIAIVGNIGRAPIYQVAGHDAHPREP